MADSLSWQMVSIPTSADLLVVPPHTPSVNSRRAKVCQHLFFYYHFSVQLHTNECDLENENNLRRPVTDLQFTYYVVSYYLFDVNNNCDLVLT